MKSGYAAFLATLVGVGRSTLSVEVSPVQKVLQLLGDLQAKVVKEGEESQKTYAEFSEWCEDRAKNLKYEIATGKDSIEQLDASIEKASGMIASHSANVEDTAASLATNEADLKAATQIREVEEKDFAAAETELQEVVSALERAVAVIEREMHKGGAAMLQLQRAPGVVQAMQVLVDSSLIGSQDASRLAALVQQKDRDADSDEFEALGAPEAEAYTSKSGGIVETLENLLDKAKDELEAARKKEMNEKHNFDMLKQSLEDEIKFSTEDMDKAKKGKAVQSDLKASFEGDRLTTKKELDADESTQKTLKQDCLTRSQDFEAEVRSRAEELKALKEAEKVISEQTAGAADVTYGASSFLQHFESSGLRTASDLANFEAVRLVRRLAEKEHSQALMQLARRMATAIRQGSGSGADPFAKVKDLIRNMLETLESDANADASHKAYCDKELGDTLSKRVEKEAEVDKLSTSIDGMTAKSAQLKEEVAALQAGLAELARSESELTSIRQEEKGEYEKNKPDMLKGLEAVKMAMRILREYYAADGKDHSAAMGASSGIIGMLEVVESDFSKNLAEMSAAEASSQSAYEQEMQANAIERATASQSEKYKAKESAQLDTRTAESTSDRDGVQAELSAILDYKAKLQQMCISKPETYGERKARREAELAGLKEALSILDGEAVLMQRRSRLTFRRAGHARAARLRGGRGATLSAAFA